MLSLRFISKDSSISTPKPKPSLVWMLASPARIIAFGFGSGLLHPAPGTWGTLCAVLIWYALSLFTPIYGILGLAVIAISFLIGCWAAEQSNRDLGVQDAGGIVWDEFVAVWLVLWASHTWFDTWTHLLLAFVLFRGFDILKPWPIKLADRYIKNGFGVMFDDILAALYSLAGLWLIAYVFSLVV